MLDDSFGQPIQHMTPYGLRILLTCMVNPRLVRKLPRASVFYSTLEFRGIDENTPTMVDWDTIDSKYHMFYRNN